MQQQNSNPFKKATKTQAKLRLGSLPKPAPTARQLATIEDRFWQKVSVEGDCWLWDGMTDPHGYGLVQINLKRYKAHRISYQLNHHDPGEWLVLHDCDNPLCVNPAHLFLGTDLDNATDRMAKGRLQGQQLHPERYPRGEAKNNAKLTRAKAREVRERYAAGGVSLKTLAREYLVSIGTIRSILSGKSWKEA